MSGDTRGRASLVGTPHDVGDGCPEDSGEHWRDLHAAVERQVVRYRDQIGIMSREQSQREKDVYAAAKRAAWDSVLRNAELYVKSQAIGELRALAYQLEHLPQDRLKPADVDFVRMAARDLRTNLEAFDVEKPGTALAEVRRLREALYAAGRQLHEQYGTSNGERCGCPGCEMTRAAELVTDPERDR